MKKTSQFPPTQVSRLLHDGTKFWLALELATVWTSLGVELCSRGKRRAVLLPVAVWCRLTWNAGLCLKHVTSAGMLSSLQMLHVVMTLSDDGSWKDGDHGRDSVLGAAFASANSNSRHLARLCPSSDRWGHFSSELCLRRRSPSLRTAGYATSGSGHSII